MKPNDLAVIDALEARIANWRRAVLGRGINYGQCMSAEGNFRSPQHWHPEGPRPSAVDMLDADLLERAWRTIRPLQARQIVLWNHVYRLAPWVIVRRVRQVYSSAIDFDAAVIDADDRFAQAIGREEGVMNPLHFLRESCI